MSAHDFTRRRPVAALLLAMLVPLLGACTVMVDVPFIRRSEHGPARTVILTAFGDAAATYGETQPFLLALQNRVVRTPDSACGTSDARAMTRPRSCTFSAPANGFGLARMTAATGR